jgi:ribosomal protein S18 acetylase RimI-like enzyme
MQARRGELVDALDGDGLVAVDAGAAVGLVTWHVDLAGTAAEIRCLVVVPEARGQGIGRALVAAAHARVREVGVRRAWLVTTNDNLRALALYQRLGYQLVALRAGFVDASRRTLKPSIGEIGEHGIPIRDELELELELGPEVDASR